MFRDDKVVRKKKMRSLELFCGAGGLALGLGQAGFAHDGLFERDSDCCRNIADNIQRGCPLTENWKIFEVMSGTFTGGDSG